MPQELSKIPAVDGAQIRNGAGPAKERAKKSKSRSIVMAGLDPAIQTRIEMLRFFLDGRVKHGHDEGKILPRFDFSGRDFSRTSRTAINACACDDPLSASQHYAPQCARDDGLG
jgi:hypothetical protein